MLALPEDVQYDRLMAYIGDFPEDAREFTRMYYTYLRREYVTDFAIRERLYQLLGILEGSRAY